MTWEKRLRDLLLAGGAVATVACSSSNAGPDSPNIPCGNANPDPCICGRPDASAQSAALCDQQRACEAQGGRFDQGPSFAEDGAVQDRPCILGDGGTEDGGSDANSDGPAHD